MRHELDIAAADARDDRAVLLGQVELAEAMACYLRIRDKDAPIIQLAPVKIERLAARLAQVRRHPVQLLRRADDGEQIPGVQRAVARCQFQPALALDPPEHHIPMLRLFQLSQRRPGQVVPRHAQRSVRESVRAGADIAQRFRFPRVIDFPAPLEHGDRENHRNDAHRIGDGVGDDRLVEQPVERGGGRLGADRFEDGGQRGRVGQRAGKHPGGERRREAQRGGEQSGQQQRAAKRGENEQVIAQPFAPERRKETGAAREPDGIDEYDEAKVVENLG